MYCIILSEKDELFAYRDSEWMNRKDNNDGQRNVHEIFWKLKDRMSFDYYIAIVGMKSVFSFKKCIFYLLHVAIDWIR